MKVKKGNLKTTEILKINSGISEIQNMNTDADTVMDLGIIKASLETVVREYQNAVNKEKLNLLKKYNIDEESENINVIQRTELNVEIDNLNTKLGEKEYEVSYPEFSKSEIKSWIERDKDCDKENSFNPTLAFFTNMADYIK